ncbi:ABC transporter permease [Granulicatella balaenopterae]|nr:ABC transporter permease [Granulicatella balaenopterae]
MNNKMKLAFKYQLLSLVMVLVIWYLLTWFVSPLLIPKISVVLLELVKIVTVPDYLLMIWITTKRLLIGMAIGVSVGIVLGVAMGKVKAIDHFFSPIVSILQTIPPISWLALALVWFGFNGKPAIFIVVTSLIPIISINTREGFKNIDQGLLEMAQIYQLNKQKIYIKIVLPTILPYIRSATKIGLGMSWKVAVMGEVLTTNDGIGGMIKEARNNLEVESIIAWSIMIVILFNLTTWLLKKMFKEEGAK